MRLSRRCAPPWSYGAGPALSDFAYEEFAQPYVQRLNDMHLDAIETLASSELEAGRAGQAIPLLDAAIRDDPLRERSRELLMLALYRSGRHAEALRNYDNLRVQLRDELGLDPSPALQRMRDRVLLHDPALVPVGRTRAGRSDHAKPVQGPPALRRERRGRLLRARRTGRAVARHRSRLGSG